MANTVLIKSSATAAKLPTTSTLSLRELAVNTADGKLYLRQGTGVAGDNIYTVNPWNQSAGGSSYNLSFSAGNVGINTVSNTPSSTLEVYGTGTFRPATTQDAIAIAGRAGGTSSYVVTITPTTLTASRTLTAPNTSGTIVTTGDTATVTNTMLASSSITINGTAISLGGSSSINNSISTTSTNATYYPTIVSATTGNLALNVVSSGLTFNPSTGVLSATKFSGDGSSLTNVVAVGSGVTVQSSGTNLGTASTINFSTNLTATFSTGVATVSFLGGTLTNALTLATGTASLAPLKLQAGTNLTTATSGVIEYDGTVFYQTPNTSSSRGVTPGFSYYRLNADLVGNTGTTAQKVFGVGLSVAASTTYAFEYVYYLTKTAGTNAHTVNLNFGGTATFNNALHESTVTSNVTSGLNAAIVTTNTLSTNLSYTLTGTAAIQLIWVGRGTFSVNAAGTVIPQYTLSTSPGGAYSTAAASYIAFWPIGPSGSNNSVGNWA